MYREIIGVKTTVLKDPSCLTPVQVILIKKINYIYKYILYIKVIYKHTYLYINNR